MKIIARMTRVQEPPHKSIEEIKTIWFRVWGLEFLISLYGAPLAQRTSYVALHSSLFGPDCKNYDYNLLSLTALTLYWLKMYSQWCQH